MFSGDFIDNMYILHTPTYRAYSVSCMSNASAWGTHLHARLRHRHYNPTIHAHALQGIDTETVDSGTVCEHCAVSKLPKAPFTQPRRPPPTEPLQVVVTDVVGPVEV